MGVRFPLPAPAAAAWACLAWTLALSIACAYADYGTAMFVTGAVSLLQSSGKSRPLAKGAHVQAGDLLRTGAGARAQIRFSDGAYLSLTPGAELRIDAYRYGGEAKGREAAFFTLYRGSARFIAGAIGKLPGSRFRVSTAVAAIDMQSSEFAMILGKGLQVNVGAGRVSITNDAGALLVDAGERAFVVDRRTPPYLIGTLVPDRVSP